MPNIKSAVKRMKTSEKARQRNRSTKSATRTARRRLLEVISTGDKEQSAGELRKYYSVLDSAVKKGAIKANTASRSKSRAARKIASLA